MLTGRIGWIGGLVIPIALHDDKWEADKLQQSLLQ